MTLKVKWFDGGRNPQCAPDPRYPKGIDLDCSNGAAATCGVALPYPAKRCGKFFVECDVCGTNAIVSTAGRADDPRSLKMACITPKVVQ